MICGVSTNGGIPTIWTEVAAAPNKQQGLSMLVQYLMGDMTSCRRTYQGHFLPDGGNATVCRNATNHAQVKQFQVGKGDLVRGSVRAGFCRSGGIDTLGGGIDGRRYNRRNVYVDCW